MKTLADTIALFPSLAAALATDAPDPSALVAWLRSQETGRAGAGRKASARLVLSWHGGDLGAAWAALDSRHRDAVRAMLAEAPEVVEVEGQAVEMQS